MMNKLQISEEIRALGQQAEREIMPYFARIEEICEKKKEKVIGKIM